MILLILAIAMVGIMAYAYVITRAQAFLCLVAAGVLIAVAIIASRLHAIDFWGRDVFAQAMMGMAMVLGGWGWARLFTADQDARVKLLRAMIPSVASQRRDTSPFTIELGALAFVVIGISTFASSVW